MLAYFLLRAVFSFCDKGCFNYKLPFVIDSISNNVCKYDVSQLYLAISCTFHFSRECEKKYEFLARNARNARNEKYDKFYYFYTKLKLCRH